MRSLVFVVAALLCVAVVPARAQSIDRQALTMLTELITVELSKDRRLGVISSTDVREVVALEAEKQVMGCESSTSCLAEVAGAMGARFVVFGQLGKLGSVYLLSLHLFDSEAATAAGRVVVQAESLEHLVAQVEGAVAQLVGRALEGRDEETALRVLVLDLKAASGTVEEPAAVASEEPPPPEAEGSFPWLLWSGVAGAGLGGATLAAGFAFGAIGLTAFNDAKAAPVQVDAERKLSDANTWGMVANIAFIAGGVVLASGAGMTALGLVLGGE